MPFLTYKDAGVDIKKADEVLNRLKPSIHATYNPYVLNSIGGFGSLTAIPAEYANPVMVNSTDGVGTKLKVAFQADKHDTVGIDLVAMSANDVLTLGAKPYFFLDYFACGKIEERVYEAVISGICEGCNQAACALVGGETAEMPSFYKNGEYDLAGFVTGFVERERIVDGSTIRAGDILIGLSSSGLHSNGYSLVRKALFEIHNVDLKTVIDGLGCSLSDELLRPTRIYARPVLDVLDRFTVKGMAHITGGGLPGNIGRIVPDGLAASITLLASRISFIFNYVQELGNVSFEEMCRTFNMGIGYVMVVDPADATGVMERLSASGQESFPIGSVHASRGKEKVFTTLEGVG